MYRAIGTSLYKARPTLRQRGLGFDCQGFRATPPFIGGSDHAPSYQHRARRACPQHRRSGLHPGNGRGFAEIVRLRRRRGRLLGEGPAAAGVVRLRIGAHGLRPKEKARRKRPGMPGRSGVEDDSGCAFRFRCHSRFRCRDLWRCCRRGCLRPARYPCRCARFLLRLY